MPPERRNGFTPSWRSAQQGFTPSWRSAQQGFTLVEVLVALVVTSMILGIVMNASLQAKARAIAAFDKQEAIMLARGLLAERAVAPFDPAPREGRSANLRWSIGESAVAGDLGRQFVLAEARVVVRDSKGVVLADLQSRRIKAAPRT